MSSARGLPLALLYVCPTKHFGDATSLFTALNRIQPSRQTVSTLCDPTTYYCGSATKYKKHIWPTIAIRQKHTQDAKHYRSMPDRQIYCFLSYFTCPFSPSQKSGEKPEPVHQLHLMPTIKLSCDFFTIHRFIVSFLLGFFTSHRGLSSASICELNLQG